MVKGLPQVVVPKEACKECIEYNRCVPTEAIEKLGIIHFGVYGHMKHEVLDIFKEFKCLVGVQSGRVIKVLRTYGGGEYVSNKFKEFCKSEGVIHKVTPPYTPQNNGTVEKRNKIMLNLVRCMLKNKNIPSFLWEEAISIVGYILNRSSTRIVEDKTPEEAWTGAKLNVTHLRIFGLLRRKLDDKGTPHILIGYHSTRGYKLYELESGQVFTSKEVICDEN
ncbi:hypothetical protein CR513_11212, partial [Mucuna pruriens]